jgi:spermidine synthase
VRPVLADGRVWIAHADEQKFDVVVSDLFVPWHAGTGTLYSREHFVEVREGLSEDGLFALWLPLWQMGEREFRTIAATFHDVFPQAEVWQADLAGGWLVAGLVGWHGRPRYDDGAIAARLERHARGDLLLGDVDSFGLLRVGPLEGAPGAPRNTVDRPVVEFLAPRSHKERALYTAASWSAAAVGMARADGAWARRARAGRLAERGRAADALALAPASGYLKAMKGPPAGEHEE